MPDHPATPWPAPLDAPALIVGGTFDPPHIAHTQLTAAARNRVLGPNAWLIFVPAARSPHKSDAAIATDADRTSMLALAIADVPRAAIWTDELDRAAADQPSWSVDSFTRARTLLGSAADLRFVLGSDQALAFHRWRKPQQILDLASPVVLLRDPVRTPDDLRRALAATGKWSDAMLDRWHAAAVDVGSIDVSATDIRKALADGNPTPPGLDPAVGEFIHAHNLYREIRSTDDVPGS